MKGIKFVSRTYSLFSCFSGVVVLGYGISNYEMDNNTGGIFKVSLVKVERMEFKMPKVS